MILLKTILFYLAVLTTFRFIAELITCVNNKTSFDIVTYTNTPAITYALLYACYLW
jgi:hypothetical protein